MQGHAQRAKSVSDLQKIAPRMPFLQPRKYRVVYRLDRRNDKQAPRGFQLRNLFFVFPQMLDFYGCVVSDLGEFAMELLHQRNRMADAIEKVWIAKRNMLCAARDLPADVFHHNFAWHDAKNTVVYRHNRAVPAQVLASPASFRGAYNAVAVAGNNQVRVLLHLRQTRAVRHLKI